MSTLWKISFFGLLMSVCASAANAGLITCEPSDQRVATLGDALECKTDVDINLNDADDLNALFETNYAWIKEGELTAEGSDDLFSVATDSWGTDVTGTWAIDSSFWNVYSRAVITMHVGHGGGNPDAFAWVITPGQTSGSFTYERVGGKGGGLSNMFLFGSGTPNITLPESNIGILLVIGLLSIFFARRRVS